MGNYFDRFDEPTTINGVDMSKPLQPADLARASAPPAPPPPPPGGNYFDRYDPPSPEQARRAQAYSRGQSIGPTHEGLWDRFKDVASDAIHHSPAGWLANVLAGHLPAAEDYQAGGDNSQAALQARAAPRVVQAERDYRDQYAGRTADDPWRRPDGSMIGNAARFGADALGMVGGGLISDPTNAIAPGDSLLAKMLWQGGISAASDAGLQGLEMGQGVRDNFDPLETATSAAAGPVFVAGSELAHNARPIAQGIRDFFVNRGRPQLPDGELQAGPLDGGPGYDPTQTLASAGLTPDHFSSPDQALAAAERIRAAQSRAPVNDLDLQERARQQALQSSIDQGITDPSFAAQPAPRVMPGEVPIFAAPEGLVRGDDRGAMAGLDRKRAVDESFLQEAHGRAQMDPVIAEVLNANVSPQTKLATLYDRLQRFREHGPDGVPDFGDIPEAKPAEAAPRAARYQAPTGDAGASHPAMDRMWAITEGSESRGRDVGPDGKVLTSPAGAKGRMQVMDTTNGDPGFGVRPAANGSLEERARVGRDYLNALMHHYGDPSKAWAAYNWGPGNLDNALRAHGDDWFAHAPAETRAYVEKNVGQLGGQVPTSPAPADYQVGSPDQAGEGMFSARTRVDRVPGEPGGGPVREDFQGFERTEHPTSPTNQERDQGFEPEIRGQGERQRVVEDPTTSGRMQAGTSDRPFPPVRDDPEGQPGFWERRALEQHDAAFQKAQADLEAEWTRRQQAEDERRRRGGKTRFEEERTAGGPDPQSRYGSSGYGQTPHRADDVSPWSMTDDGHIADNQGRPVAFRNARAAASWAAKNQMGGDFELGSWGTNSSRVVLRRRDTSTYGARPERPTPGAGPVEPPAGRTADASQRALESPYSADTGGRPSDSGEAPNRAPGASEADFRAPERPPVPEETRPPVVGPAEQVVTARGRPVDTEFHVREARDLVTSDHPAYDPALQPRERGTRATSDAQIAEISSHLDPEQLHSSRLASQGAPIVGPDRMVESGNGRVAAIRRAYDQHPDQAAAYRQMIEDRGLKTDGFDQPVLVRSRKSELGDQDRLGFVREANERDTMSMSSAEQAKADAGAVSDATLSKYRGGSVSDAGNRDFVRSWMNEAATPAERNSLVQSDGSISTDGLRRIRASMLSKAFGDADLVGKIVEDPDNGIRSIGNVLTDAAPEFVKLKQRVAAGELPAEFDISKHIGEMAHLIARARSEGKSPLDLVRQNDIFGGSTNPTTEALVRMMFKNDEMKAPRSAADMAEGLRFYTQEAAKTHHGPSLLGDQHEKLAPADIIKAATAKLDAKGGGGNGAKLFMRSPGEDQGRLSDRREPLADALRRMASSQENPHVQALASRLSELVGDTEHRYAPSMGRRGEAKQFADGSVRTTTRNPLDHEATLHEGVHAATLTRYRELLDNVHDPRAKPIISELQAIRDRALKAYRPAQDPSGVVKDALENSDELLAYGLTSKPVQDWMKGRATAGLWGRFVDWTRGLLGLAPKHGEFLDRVLTAGARLIHEMERGNPDAASRPERTLHGPRDDEAPETVHPGRPGFGRIVDAIVDTDGFKGDAAAVKAAVGNPVSTVKAMTQPMQRMISAAMFTNDARVRSLAARFKSEALAEYANLWHARAGKGDGTGRTYHEAVSRAATTRTQRTFEALEPFLKNKPALSRIRDLLAQPTKSTRATASERDAAKSLRDLLKETIEYRKDAGEDIGEVTDGYFPRMLDVAKVTKNRDAFLKSAESVYRSVGASDPKAAAEAWFGHIFDTYAGLDAGPNFVRGSGGGMGSATAKAREFGKLADGTLKDFYDHDVFHVLASYFTGAAKRAEYARRFGMPGREGSAKRLAWTAEHGDNSQFDVLMDRIKGDIRKSDQDPAGALHVIDSVHRSNLGQMGARDPFTRNATSYLHTWNQVSKMDRTLITSLGELTMGFIRGGPRYGFTYVKDSLTEMARMIRGAEPSDAARWGEAVGVANDAAVNQVLTSRLDAEHATAGAQKILTGYYKGIGLHQFTEGERIAAVKMARKMVDVFSHDMVSPTARVRQRAALYLKELGLKDPEAFAKQMRSASPTREEVIADRGGFASDYATALMRVVNQTVMVPDRAIKPTWSAHPVGGLVFSLMSYNYAFKRNVMDRAGRLAIEGVKTHDPALLVPAFSLSLMAAFQALNDTYLRPLLFGSHYDFSTETPTEMMMRVADRAGFTGGLSPIINAIRAVKYDRSLSESLSGPVLGTIGDAGNKFVQLYSDRNSPNTNTAERNAAGALYDTIIEPAMDAFAAARLKGLLKTAVIMGTGNRSGGVLPGDKDAFVDETAGEPTAEQRDGS